MNADNLKILFVGHEASRTGAPIALLHLVRWLKEHTPLDASFLLGRGGPLQGEYAELFPTNTLNDSTWLPWTRKRRILRRLGLDQLGARIKDKQILRPQIPKPDLIYCNSLACVPAMELAATLDAPVLLHLHELEYSFRAGVGPAASAKALSLSSRFVACAQAVADNLIKRHDVPADRVDVVHGFLPLLSDGSVPESGKTGWLLKHLGLPPNTLLVGGSGQGGWRKGADLFIQLAVKLAEARPDVPVHFVWLGGDPDSTDVHQLRHDIELSGATDRVTHVPTQSDPNRYFREMDVFVLPSREDPYPLVCLEAAAAGVPIICFDRAGGMPEFIETDSGIVVPYLNLDAMTEAVVDLLHDEERRRLLGRTAQSKVRARHDISIAGPMILAAIHRAIGKNRRPRGSQVVDHRELPEADLITE